jgi:hypothetical protein
MTQSTKTSRPALSLDEYEKNPNIVSG